MRLMKIVLAIGLFSTLTSAQVCNSASTLKPGRFSLGIAPILYVGHSNDMGLFINGGVGLTKSVDLSLKMVLDDQNYFGGDFEFVVLSGMPTISLAAGVHKASALGLDGTFNITFPIRNVLSIYGGLDADVNFHDDHTRFPMWGFVGFQAMVRSSLALFMEIDIGVNDGAPDMLALGMNVFF